MKDIFQSNDTNLLGDINLSDMNVMSSQMGESEPRAYGREVDEPPRIPEVTGGFHSPVKEIPDQEDMEESQYN
jgi:hypothetical protein